MAEAAARRDQLGNAMTWLTAGSLALSLVLVVGMLGLIALQGLGYFWQKPLYENTLADGGRVLGEVHETDLRPVIDGTDEAGLERYRLKTGNRDLDGLDFRWVDAADVTARSAPADAVSIERSEWGSFHGYVLGLRDAAGDLTRDADRAWQKLGALLERKEREFEALHRIETRAIGDVNYALESLRLERRGVELALPEGAERTAALAEIDTRVDAENTRYQALYQELLELRSGFEAERLLVATADGRETELVVGHIVRVLRPNELGVFSKLALYFERFGEFIWAEPRESNTEGGIFPAIFGTVMMVFLMSLIVVPFGVIAAIYMHEYAKDGVVLRLVRIAVNNLAGVPSIVFGVFGLGFFVYLVGGTIDQLFYPEALPAPTYGTGGILWASLTLALLTVPVVIVATEEGLSAVPRALREGSLALGATRFETIRKVVLPAASPGVLTGLILAMARAAGEVAPLMIVGMVKLAPSLPVDHHFPFVHFERKFMHLGFHIYDLGFQSPNVEAVKPLVFATALLLIAVVLATNLTAIVLRNRMRQRYGASAI